MVGMYLIVYVVEMTLGISPSPGTRYNGLLVSRDLRNILRMLVRGDARLYTKYC